MVKSYGLGGILVSAPVPIEHLDFELLCFGIGFRETED